MGFIKTIFILLFLFILVIGGYMIINEVNGGGSITGAFAKQVDPCERSFDQCNRGCGEGIFNSICKEKCSYDYRRCRK